MTALLGCTTQPQVVFLGKEPSNGELHYGQVVYVDDGKCPSGQVKEITGGSREEGVAQKVRCVKHPG